MPIRILSVGAYERDEQIQLLFFTLLILAMKFTHFIGVDISKESFDVCFCSEAKPDQFAHKKFFNSTAGCQQLLTWLGRHKVDLQQCFFAMEHTGWYTLELCCFLQNKQLAFALYSPLHLKRSLGIARGKNDRVDAQRLAHYTFLHGVPRTAMNWTPVSFLQAVY